MSGQLRQYDYKPYGDTLQSGSYNNLRGYEGSERDPESRYMNLGARLYDPIIGRFLSVDPLWEAFPSWSPYQYAYNCPISYKDPTGLAPQKEKGDRVMAVQFDYRHQAEHDANCVEMMESDKAQTGFDKIEAIQNLQSSLFALSSGISFYDSHFGEMVTNIGTPEENGGRTGESEVCVTGKLGKNIQGVNGSKGIYAGTDYLGRIKTETAEEMDRLTQKADAMLRDMDSETENEVGYLLRKDEKTICRLLLGGTYRSLAKLWRYA